jgi:hypothetical protein
MSQFHGSADEAAPRGSAENTATASRNRRESTYMPMSRVWSARWEARAPDATACAWIWRPKGRWDAETQPRRSSSKRYADGAFVTAAVAEKVVEAKRHGRGGGLRLR